MVMNHKIAFKLVARGATEKVERETGWLESLGTVCVCVSVCVMRIALEFLPKQK